MACKVLITGATGHTGTAAVRESLLLGLQVRVMVHASDERSSALEALGAEVKIGNLQEIDTIHSAMEGMDAAYFVYPVKPGLLTAVVNFAQAAKEADLSFALNLSQRSADRHSKSDSCRDNYIAEQVLNWSGLPVIHLRPTFFLEWLLYPFQISFLRNEGVLRLPVGKGRHSPIAAADQGRAIAALFKSPAGLLGQTINLSGPVEMDHEQIAAELSAALGREIVFQDLPVSEYCDSLAKLGVAPYVLQHYAGAMEDYQHGHMSGADNNIEGLTGKRPMTVGEFAKAHLDQLNTCPWP